MGENEKNNWSSEDVALSLSTEQLVEMLKQRSNTFTPEQQKAFDSLETAFAKPVNTSEGKMLNEYPIFPEVEKAAEQIGS